MTLDGAYEFPAPRAKVWAALLDPAVLGRTLPGCDKLEAIRPGEYRAIVKVGVAAVKGTFEGEVKLADLEPPTRYRMSLEGSGGPGFVRGEASLELVDMPGGTRVHYRADVQVGGLIAGVGQRMLGGVARMVLEQFFARIATELGASA